MTISPGTVPGGRLTVFSEPSSDRRYTCGLDFAYGLRPTADGDKGGDDDAAVLLDDKGDQVATLVGKWGNAGFLSQLRPLLDWYKPLICGEQQVGLEVLRSLYRESYWMYYDRDEAKRSRPVMDKLGHFKTRAKIPIMMLRKALGARDDKGLLLPPKIKVRDAQLHGQLCSYQFMASGGVDIYDAGDDSLKMSAPPGEHDDLVNACAYAYLALCDMPFYQQPKPRFEPGSLGALLGHEEVRARRSSKSALTGR